MEWFLLVSALLVLYNGALPNIPGGFQDRTYVQINLLTGVLLLGAVHWGLGTSWSTLGLHAEGLLPSAGWGTLLGLGLGGSLVAASLCFRRLPNWTRPLRGVPGVAAQGNPAFNLLVRIPVGTALFEELLFRGVLFALLPISTSPLAVLATSAAFALWHVGPIVATLRKMGVHSGLLWTLGLGGGLVATFTGGALFGVLRQATGHVAGPVMAHALINDLALLAWHSQQRRQAKAAHG